MRYIGLLFIGLVFAMASCKQNIKKQELSALNGYWEIEKVITSEGQIKEYKINTTIDYIQLETAEKGFRKKVYPSLEGRYQTSEDTQYFTLKYNANAQWEMIYHSNQNTWTETLITLSNNNFVILNQAGMTYHYKRWQPFETQQ